MIGPKNPDRSTLVIDFSLHYLKSVAHIAHLKVRLYTDAAVLHVMPVLIAEYRLSKSHKVGQCHDTIIWISVNKQRWRREGSLFQCYCTRCVVDSIHHVIHLLMHSQT